MSLPSALLPTAELHYQLLISEHPHIANWPSSVLNQLRYVLGLSQFVAQTLQRDDPLCQVLPSLLAKPSREQDYRSELAQWLAECQDEAVAQKRLRQFRNQEMVYIAWRDFCASWTLEESLSHLSQLAEALIFESYQWLYQRCCLEMGTPCNAQGEAQPMLIIGMGKLGGGELNFSSDIDLIFTYPENGETQARAVRLPMRNFSHA